nr:MAG TPA: syndecan-2 protein [Caudoviricetes sp.]
MVVILFTILLILWTIYVLRKYRMHSRGNRKIGD